jgi:glycosyltransferase involved in cell wall biosynthesis
METNAAASVDVSVVVCTHNGERTLPAALDSLRRQSLDRERFEVIVVDDGSTDGSAAVAAAHGARVVRIDPNRGLAAARNAGVSAANGAIVAFTDDDCEPERDWLATLLASFSAAATDGVGGRVCSASSDGFVLGYVAARCPLAPLGADLLSSASRRYRLWLYLHGVLGSGPRLAAGASLYSVVGANMAFRRELIFELAGFDEAFAFGGEEEELCRRAHARAGGARLLYEPEAVVRHRFEPSLRDTLRRSRAYGKGKARSACKDANVRLVAYPSPIVALGMIVASLLSRRRTPVMFGAILPLFAYSRWPRSAWRTQSLAPLAYPYLQLAEEAWTMLGELEGRRSGYVAVPSTQLQTGQTYHR